jgi:Sulfotransferase domain
VDDFMTLKVIGAGFGRTGTLSLKLALEELGLGPCYHMVEVNAHPDHDALWLALACGEASDWRPMLKGYASTVDWPTTYFWKALAAANPDAKIILTVRDPEEWYGSAAATIFARMIEFETLRSDPDAVDPVRRRHMDMVNTIVVEKTFGGWLDRARAIAVFNAHNEDVRHSVPTERLLVYESRDGWEKLCAFLDVPVPATPYPKVNTTDDFVSRFPYKR